MAELDIDKLIEQKEKQEQLKNKMKIFRQTGIIAGIVAAAVIIAVVTVIVLMGESSTAYFPLKNTGKYTYNKKNRSPEVWQIKDKKVIVGDYECVVLEKTDQADYSTTQEYYMAGKKGIIRLAVSNNSGVKKQDKMRILPERMKLGLEFNAGNLKNTEITGKIAEKKEVSTPIGECRVYRVEYRAGSYMNKDVWYAKDAGVLKFIDAVSGVELDLVSRVEK